MDSRRKIILDHILELSSDEVEEIITWDLRNDDLTFDSYSHFVEIQTGLVETMSSETMSSAEYLLTLLPTLKISDKDFSIKSDVRGLYFDMNGKVVLYTS